MKLVLLALLVGGAIFGTVYGLAATLNVGFGTASTGTGDVGTCSDVTGSTYILHGAGVSPLTDQPGDPSLHTTLGDGTAVESGVASDITNATEVNIELSSDQDCHGINISVQLYSDNAGTIPIVGANGSCQVWPKGGLGYDETASSDNVQGCTVVFSGGDVPVASIESLAVTES